MGPAMAVPDDGDRRKAQAARNLAFINYALLFAAVLFAGVPAIAAAVIAYAQRDEAPPRLASHFAFQIRVFWIAFAMAMAAAATFLGAMVKIAAAMFEVTRIEGWNSPDVVRVDLTQVTLDAPLVILLGLTALFAAVGGLWLVLAPALGAMRLASGRPMGHGPRP
jgi:Predicted membrane protein